jgi:hypothetical protein
LTLAVRYRDRGLFRLRKVGLAPLALLPLGVVAISGGYPRWSRQCSDFVAMVREGRQAFAENRVTYMPVARWLNDNMRDGEKVAIGFNVQPFYYLDRPYFHIHPLTEGALVAAQSPEEVEAILRHAGVTLLAFSEVDYTYTGERAPKISAYRERLWWFLRRLRKAGRLRTVTKIAGVKILRLEDPGETASRELEDPTRPDYSAHLAKEPVSIAPASPRARIETDGERELAEPPER